MDKGALEPPVGLTEGKAPEGGPADRKVEGTLCNEGPPPPVEGNGVEAGPVEGNGEAKGPLEGKPLGPVEGNPGPPLDGNAVFDKFAIVDGSCIVDSERELEVNDNSTYPLSSVLRGGVGACPIAIGPRAWPPFTGPLK